MEAEQELIARRVVTHGEVCPDPEGPCPGYFHANELSFKLDPEKRRAVQHPRKVGFLGVYAGRTEAEAKQFLAEVKAGGRFPGANYRRMQVLIVNQLE